VDRGGGGSWESQQTVGRRDRLQLPDRVPAPTLEYDTKCDKFEPQRTLLMEDYCNIFYFVTFVLGGIVRMVSSRVQQGWGCN